MKDIINSKVKFREAFRPFAPSVLEDRAQLVFELPKSPDTHLPLRFMLYVLPVQKAWQKKVPAINHADNTARPQLVYKNSNSLYYNLIHSFYKKTGVPLILNTSFNLKGEPIVSSPADAYSTFMRSGIDILVMGNFVVEK
jgi:carbamoyltransferase